MRKWRTVSAIDVGTTKVCTLIGEVGENGQMRIAGIGMVPSRGLHKGMVVNINEAKEAIRDSVRKAEQASVACYLICLFCIITLQECS